MWRLAACFSALSPQLLSSLSLNVNTPKPSWLQCRAQQIPGRINAGLNQINTIQACSIGVSIQTYRETADSACDEGGPSNSESSRLYSLMFLKAATLVDRRMPGASSELISLQPHWDTGTWASFPRPKPAFCLFIVRMSWAPLSGIIHPSSGLLVSRGLGGHQSLGCWPHISWISLISDIHRWCPHDPGAGCPVRAQSWPLV